MTDEEILNLLAEKQYVERGFRLLMEKYQERLYWHIRRMVTNHEDANDVVQNCFIKVFRNVHKFQRKSALYTWLYRIATNEAITFINRRKRRKATSIDSEDSILARQLKADVYFDGEEIQLKLQCALDTLPKKQHLVFNMRYFEEMTYKQMSEVSGTSVGALKASYHHAVKKIELFLKEE